ncbi:hypothetical protein ACFVUN_35860 [Kitasatospora griseola]|uniref:hypothetical protein n=1 Tax=Kitasatospora griseola TaxID=2064 RepID=UPI0036DE4121
MDRRTDTEPLPLPLPELADPDDVAAAALLLAGDDGFATGAREWEHAGLQAEALVGGTR